MVALVSGMGVDRSYVRLDSPTGVSLVLLIPLGLCSCEIRMAAYGTKAACEVWERPV
jgi:hypothetical protein